MNIGLYILLVMLPSLLITGWAALRVRSTYAKWSKVDSGINMDAFAFARKLLDRQGLTDVQIEPTPGQLTDNYDPRGKVLHVSQAVSGGPQAGSYDPRRAVLNVPSDGQPHLSVAAAAVIAHEVGHRGPVAEHPRARLDRPDCLCGGGRLHVRNPASRDRRIRQGAGLRIEPRHGGRA